MLGISAPITATLTSPFNCVLPPRLASFKMCNQNEVPPAAAQAGRWGLERLSYENNTNEDKLQTRDGTLNAAVSSSVEARSPDTAPRSGSPRKQPVAQEPS